MNENVICMLKRFKIIADKYRNKRKRFGLRFKRSNIELFFII
ncbi:putative transposase, partial [Orientia tsutsugamushi str. UT76]